MNLENVWVTTKLVKDSYGYKVPANTIVTWEPNKPLKGVLDPELFTYFPISNQTLFRRPTQDELDSIESTPIYNKMCVRGLGYTIGSDPEMFVTTPRGAVIPAWKFLPSKAEIVKGNDPIYWDGFQAEFTVPQGTCMAYWVDNIQDRLKSLQTKARRYNPRAKLTGDSVLPLRASALRGAKNEHVELGCMPSLNAYGDRGIQVDSGRHLPIRFAGCHIHLGHPTYQKKNTPDHAVKIVKACDAIAGVLSVAILEGLESPERRKYYGLAGEYRLPSHGVEYRVLSSAILWHPGLFHMHCNFVRFARELVENGLEGVWHASEDEVRETINTLDVDRARGILARNRKIVEELFYGLWIKPQPYDHVPSPSRVFDQLVLTGVRKYLELDMDKNWHLSDDKWVRHSEGPACNGWRALIEWLGKEV